MHDYSSENSIVFIIETCGIIAIETKSTWMKFINYGADRKKISFKMEEK